MDYQWILPEGVVQPGSRSASIRVKTVVLTDDLPQPSSLKLSKVHSALSILRDLSMPQKQLHHTPPQETNFPRFVGLTVVQLTSPLCVVSFMKMSRTRNTTILATCCNLTGLYIENCIWLFVCKSSEHRACHCH